MDLTNYNRQSAAGAMLLQVDAVHVWRVSLEKSPSYVASMFETLSSDEKQKAEKYRVDTDRNLFVVARGTLRKVLGGYLNCRPDQICFSYNEYGKPFLGEQRNRTRFNIAHSGKIALFAIAHGREVGIDIEFIDKSFPILQTARRVFSQSEYAELQTVGPELQPAAFYQGWTRKEAYLKAIGTGFGGPFRKGAGWTFADLPVDHGYKAALAVEGKGRDIRYQRLSAESWTRS